MRQLFALAYASTATSPLSPRDLDVLLLDARAHNSVHDVTGVLLHSQGVFFQYLEGPEQGVESVFQRIRRSSQHENVDVLLREPVRAREFSDWQMAFCEAPQTALQTLANAQWTVTIAEAEPASRHLPGMSALLGFWRQSNPAGQ